MHAVHGATLTGATKDQAASGAEATAEKAAAVSFFWVFCSARVISLSALRT